MSRYSDEVKFCVIPTDGGDYAPNAFASFTMAGEEILQPIGSANYTVKDLSITVPSTVAKTTIPVNGTAKGNSTVQIYDNGVLIGETTSLANGVWSTTCELNEPYNPSTHEIYAKIVTPQGMELQSEVVSILYDMNMIEVSTVTMINVSHRVGDYYEERTVFDFQNPPVSIPAYWYWPDYPGFTFLIDFTNNDTTLVSNVTLHVKTTSGNQVPLSAKYDERKGLWIASGNFGSWSDYDIPTNVSVDYDMATLAVLDAGLYDEVVTSYDSAKIEFQESIAEINSLIESLEEENAKEYPDEGRIDMLKTQIYAALNLNPESGNPNIYTEDNYQELLDRCDETLLDDFSSFKDNFFAQSLDEVAELMEGVALGDCSSLDVDSLLAEGFIEFRRTDGTSLYIYTSEVYMKVADFVNNLYYEVDLSNSDSPIAKMARAASRDDFRATMEERINAIEKGYDRLRSYLSTFVGIIDDVTERLTTRDANLTADLLDLDASIQYMKANNGSKIILGLLEAKYNVVVEEKKVVNGILSWINKNISTNGLKVGRIGGGALLHLTYIR